MRSKASGASRGIRDDSLEEEDEDEKLAFDSDSEAYEEVRALPTDSKARLVRGNTGRSKVSAVTMSRANSGDSAGTKPGGQSAKWGYGWGQGKPNKDREREKDAVLDRKDSMDPLPRPPLYSSDSRSSKKTNATAVSKRSASRPNLWATDSQSTLVGSAFERKLNDLEVPKEKVDTSDRLSDLRRLMAKDTLDYYIVPSEDAHQSEYVADTDKRREWISGFTGTAGQAIVSKTTAYLVTDSRYWIQAQTELDPNWHLIPAGSHDGPKDWIDFLLDRAKDSRIGIDARMLSHDKATAFNTKLTAKNSKLIYPPQNFIDLIWKDKPARSKERIFVQPLEFTGKEAAVKIAEMRKWVRAQPAATLSYSKAPPTPAQMHVGTLITSLSNIAWLLNLRGGDIPFNPLFQSYLYLGLERAILFTDSAKISDDVTVYLSSLKIEKKEYNDLWAFLRRREWGEGKVLISPMTSYAISLMLTHFRYTVIPSPIEHLKAIKNNIEVEGMRRAYIRDGVSFVRWFAWLENKLAEGYEITEYEAAFRLTEFRKKNKHYWGLAYENISASGPNAALPHYSPTKADAKIIDRDTPYLNDSGGQYLDGTCDTTRTVHFGRPTQAQSEAYTRVLQGHIAIDSAIFPEGTTGAQLDVLARKALWKDGLNYMHGTGHGFGSFLNVHEGPHGFSSDVPLVPGHVITNEPGFYLEGQWGMRIESALAIRRVRTKGEFNGDIWLGFERLTCVPIQTRMVKDSMLTKEEKAWLKEHNQRCRDILEPYLREDKRALKWLKRESDRGIGIAASGPGGISIDW